ncbi:MAG: RNA polymerase sigma factor [Pyrinomonadaceae bacterium]
MPDREMVQEGFIFSGTAATAPAADRLMPTPGLIERVKAGDEDAFAEIYRKFAPMVHGILLVKLPYDAVQDVVQEVFLAAYKNIQTLRDEKALGGWLAAIARNHSAEYYRRSKPTEELPEEVRGHESRQFEAREVLQAIRTLPEAYCETLILRLVEGMTSDEIAERTGLQPGSVRVNLHRGMEMLRKKLGIEGANNGK